ncbi:glutathione S-transferase family protein [Xinfangfangia pollutisoli]|uniref:glutathione S-transferase family protein n=1 Tax=Xinfangfangia pollutisoli TaxID=2865960 RepID=UPI001CD38C7B|nr:glutathione S-transferase family protein [Xinfangfangia pollutisoli]
MILIGQYDSAFVRRVGIALKLYGLPFEHRPWSVFGDAQMLMQVNPLGGVPVLITDDGTALTDSKAILDHLDRLVGPERRLWPKDPDQAFEARRLTALVTGLADRFVSLFYERSLHDMASPVMSARREAQIGSTLQALERARAAAKGDWLFGDVLSHADIALACAIRHLRESLPDLFDPAHYPALAAHAARAEALPVFAEISQPFIPPA